MYKELIDILKTKLIFFSALVAGSFGYITKLDSLFLIIIFWLLIAVGVIGSVKSLYQLGELYKEIKERNERDG